MDSEHVEVGWADTAVARFHYARAGTGPPVLLVPGAGGWRFSFEALIPLLARSNTVYALDPPGQGLTEIVDRSFPYGTTAVASSIGSFLDAVGAPRTAILGHSWGGGFALRFAELHPDRVSRLALIAPGGLDVKDVWEFRLARLPPFGELAVRIGPARSTRHLLRKSFAHPERVPEHRVGDLVDMLRSPQDRATRLRQMLRVERSVRWTTTEQNLHLVTVPVLLLWGSEDRILPARLVERFTARLPTVDPHVISGGGHALHDDCPHETLALLAPFLKADHA
ncbi:alpha/beta fold hydrolase [Cryptosporangium minutisporangium]|uniref:Alpha/beta fold hydrolase n=1 Tax=Cryptosporangium minutisporangium TaxID=113569 RepID=A0ABP6T0X7_9ACTN